MDEVHVRRRWSRAEVVSRIKSAFWSRAWKGATPASELWLRYSILKANVELGGPPLSDKTFSAALNSMSAEGQLEKVHRRGRPHYRLRVDTSPVEIKAAVVAGDNQRLELASEIGVRSKLHQGISIHGIDPKAPPTYVAELFALGKETRIGVLDAGYDAAEAMIAEILGVLRKARVAPRSIAAVGRFLFRAFEFRMQIGNLPAVAGYGKGMERLLGSEFTEIAAREGLQVMYKEVRRRRSEIERFYKPIVRALGSEDPFVKGISLHLYAPGTMTTEDVARYRTELTRYRLRYPTMESLSRRWFALMKSLRPTLVLSA